MMRRTFSVFGLLSIGLFIFACYAPDGSGMFLIHPVTPTPGRQPTTVLLVRHAEVATGLDDPGLSAAGQGRAQALAHVADKAGVEIIYATPLRRTQETAKALADVLALPVTIEREPDTIAAKILSESTKRVILVVGHANTVPVIIDGLGGDGRACPIGGEFDNLCIVTIYGHGQATVLNLEYGAPSP